MTNSPDAHKRFDAFLAEFLVPGRKGINVVAVADEDGTAHAAFESYGGPTVPMLRGLLRGLAKWAENEAKNL